MEARFYAAFLPWVIFTVLTRSNGLGIVWGSIGALLAALIVALCNRKLSTLEIFAMTLFGVFTIAATLGDAQGRIANFSRALAFFCLGVFALASVVRAPFTTDYARTLVPGSVARSAAFRRLNQYLSTLWGSLAVSIAASCAVGSGLNRPMDLSVFDWLVPILLIVAAVSWTRRVWDREIDDSGSISDLATVFSGHVEDEAEHAVGETRRTRFLHIVRDSYEP